MFEKTTVGTLWTGPLGRRSLLSVVRTPARGGSSPDVAGRWPTCKPMTGGGPPSEERLEPQGGRPGWAVPEAAGSRPWMSAYREVSADRWPRTTDDSATA